MKTILGVLLLLTTAALIFVASTNSTTAHGDTKPRELSQKERDELLKFREQVWRDYFNGDKAALTKALPENFIGIGWDAGPQRGFSDRAMVVAGAEGFKQAGGKLTRLVFPETKFQAYGDVVLIYTTYELDMEFGGKKETHKGHGTEFFVKQNGAWAHPGWHLDNY